MIDLCAKRQQKGLASVENGMSVDSVDLGVMAWEHRVSFVMLQTKRI